MNASQPRNPRLTLFATVLSLFLIVALLVGTAVTLTNYFETHRTAIKVADDTFRSTISRINEQRLAFFAPAFLLTSILRNLTSVERAAIHTCPR
jgi:adenylate cyclase